MAQKFPIGIQTFADIVTGGYVYVDKTALVHKLANSGKFFFLSRPRRFGKSLLLSTLEAYFTGRRELFRGLDIDRLEHEWNAWPVLRIDLNNGDFTDDTSELTEKLSRAMRIGEQQFQLKQQSQKLGDRFADLIRGVHALTGKPVVVLIDEYDKPIIANVERGKTELQERSRDILKGFYGTLKTCDEHIRFAMLTGVSRFSKLSVFSDLNNLKDISLDNAFGGLCGITEEELRRYFGESVRRFAERYRMDTEQAYTELRRFYDGYQFNEDGPAIYNPWSLLNALDKASLGIYWSQSGTPSFLIKMLKDRQIDLTRLDGHILASEHDMSSFDSDDNTIAALYQTGYLTIKGCDLRRRRFTLGVPNEEVNETLTADMLPVYTTVQREQTTTLSDRVYAAAQAGDVDAMMNTLKGIVGAAPVESADERVLELNYRNLIAITFKLSGLAVHIEQPTSAGRIDLALEADERVYIFEFKRTTLAAAALQMESRRYADAYAADPRPKIQVAVRIDDSVRNIADWAVLEQ